MAVFIFCHAQVETLFVQPIVLALIYVLIDSFVFATEFHIGKIVVVPALTALSTIMDFFAQT